MIELEARIAAYQEAQRQLNSAIAASKVADEIAKAAEELIAKCEEALRLARAAMMEEIDGVSTP